LSTEDANNPADEAGLAAPGNDAQTDDIDTEAFDRVEAPEDDDEPDAGGEPADGDDGGDPDKPKDEAKAGDTELVEIEDDEGQKHKVPAALKDYFLRRADYTQKTQTHAEAVKAWETQRETDAAQQAESIAALRAEHVKIGVIERTIEQANAALDVMIQTEGGGSIALRDVNWPAFRAAVQQIGTEEAKLQYERLRGQYDTARESLVDLNERLGQAKTELQTKEEKRLSDAREAEEAKRRTAAQETGKVLVAEIPGWNQKAAEEVAVFMVKELGVTTEELQDATDPRIWKMAHEIKTSRAKIAELTKTQKQQTKADQHVKAQGATPAVTTKGGAGAATRDPSKPAGDALATKSWMERRNAQVAKKRA